MIEFDNILDTALERSEQIENEIKENEKKLSRIRKINLSATVLAFCTNIIGVALAQPIITISGLALLLTNLVTAPKFFKLLDKNEKLKLELLGTNMLAEIGFEKELFPEYSQINGLIGIEIREVTPKKDNDKVAKKR